MHGEKKEAGTKIFIRKSHKETTWETET